MDVDIAIQYSDDRLCVLTVCRRIDAEAIYRIVGRQVDLGSSLTEAMREARRLYNATPWPSRHVTSQWHSA